MPVFSPFQTSFGFQSFGMLPGSFQGAFDPRRCSNKIARGLLRAGRMSFMVPTVGGAGSRNSIDPGEAYQIVLAGTAADVDAILATGGVSSGSIQTITSFNGAYGALPLQPARNVTMVLNSNAAWDATTAVLTGVNHLGQTVSENLSIPDAGNTTLTSVNRYVSVTSLVIPAQTGAGGTFTLGISALSAGALTAADFFGICVRQPIKTTVSNSNLYGYPGAPNGGLTEASYIDGETAPHLFEGGIAVELDSATTSVTDRAPVYCRIAAGSGGSNLGTFGTSDDTSTAILVPGARFVREASSTVTPGVAWVHFPYV